MDTTPDPVPPIRQTPVDLPPEPSTWPTVIGVISIIYAVLAGGCMLFASTAVLWTPPVFGSFMDVQVTVPSGLVWLSLISAGVLLALAVFLLVAAIRLCKRRPSGVRLMKMWAVVRLIVLVIQIIVGIFTMDMAVDFNEQMQEVQMANIPADANFTPPTRAQLHRQQVITYAVGWSLTCIYPLFLGFFLARRRITDEVQTWSETPADII